MENKNYRTSCPNAMCEKIFKAITFNPAFTTIRRISNRQQTPSPAKQARTSDPSIKTKLISPQAASEVPIKFDYSTPKPPTLTVTGEKRKGQVQVQTEQQQQQITKKDHGNKAIQQYEENFTAYIDRTRKRITSAEQEINSSKMVGHGGFGKDHHFSEYIDQTRRKIRTTLSLKGRSESFSK